MDLQIQTGDQKWLKPAVVFSSTGHGGPGAVIAIWSDKNATAPSIVPGATVK